VYGESVVTLELVFGIDHEYPVRLECEGFTAE